MGHRTEEAKVNQFQPLRLHPHTRPTRITPQQSNTNEKSVETQKEEKQKPFGASNCAEKAKEKKERKHGAKESQTQFFRPLYTLRTQI